MKGTNVERVSNAASGYYDGSGKPPTVYTVRGVAHEVAGVPKAAFFIESIEKYEPAAATASVARPQGRDWFVRAGEAGGDGSREAPFKDPWQALERAESGDTIHVAGGEYFGKLKIGRWKLDMAYVALLGGYDANFSERNPWTHPTLLYTPPDFKGSRGGYTIEGVFDHTGAIIDGFVFDKRPNNAEQSDPDSRNLAVSGQLQACRPARVPRTQTEHARQQVAEGHVVDARQEIDVPLLTHDQSER